MVEPPRDASSGGYTSLPIKTVLSPRSEISPPSRSRARDYPPSIDVYSSSSDYCVSPDVMEGSLASAILKPEGGAVFFRVCSFLPICSDLLAMVPVSSYLPFDSA